MKSTDEGEDKHRIWKKSGVLVRELRVIHEMISKLAEFVLEYRRHVTYIQLAHFA